MRSVYVYLGDTQAVEVEDYLARTYTFQPGPPWILDIDGDPALYIDIESDPDIEAEMRRLGHQPGLTVTADVSGRHAADAEVRGFVCGLMDRFGGAAHDEYLDHHWTAEEIRSGFRVQGHPFFDYRAWDQEHPLAPPHRAA